MHFKFYEMAQHVSAAWVWQRIKRIGRSRKSLFEEKLGYIDGGSQTLVDALVKAIGEGGGRIHLSAPAKKLIVKDGAIKGVTTADGRVFDVTFAEDSPIEASPVVSYSDPTGDTWYIVTLRLIEV